jgi:DHA3 family macrolide efflux protein-like MFS transporter
MALLPQVLVAPFAGSYVDRWNRRRTMIVADFLIAVTVLILAFLFAANIVEIWQLFILMFLGSAFGAFHFPAMQASTTLMVPRKHLARVGGLNQGLNGASNIIAPPIGAILYVLLPMQSILFVDIGSAAFAILCLLMIRIPQPIRKKVAEKTSVLGDMKEGFAYLKGWRGGFVLVILAMMLNLLTAPAFSLSPILVRNYFLGGAEELAILQTAGAIAMVIGAAFLTVWGGTKRKIVTAGGALILQGFGTLFIGLTPADSFYMAVIFFAFVSFMVPVVNGVLIAIMQATIPPDKQGRVFALMIAGATAMTPLGLAFGGPISDLAGVSIFFVIAGIGTIILSIAAFFNKSLMNIEQNSHSSPIEIALPEEDEDDETRSYSSDSTDIE